MTKATGENVVWTTGAGKGIGRTLAKRLSADGWIVAASARTQVDLASLAAECPPGRVHAFPQDVTDQQMTQATVKYIEAQLGKLDTVILNAGTHAPVKVDNLSVEPFHRLVETNLMGSVNFLAPLIPRFVERQGGHIAVVSSTAGYRGLPTAAAYMV